MNIFTFKDLIEIHDSAFGTKTTCSDLVSEDTISEQVFSVAKPQFFSVANQSELLQSDLLQQYAIFPEAKEYIKYKLADLRSSIKQIEEIRKENQDIIYRKASKESEEFWNAINDIVICGDFDFSSFRMKPRSGIWFCTKMIKMVK